MKKYLILITMLTALILSGCSSSQDETLDIFNYGQYIDEELLVEFEEEFGVKVNYQEYPTPEDMYTKVKAGGTDYDLIITGEYMIERMISEDMLEKINFDNIPNYQYIDENFKNQAYDRSEEHTSEL